MSHEKHFLSFTESVNSFAQQIAIFQHDKNNLSDVHNTETFPVQSFTKIVSNLSKQTFSVEWWLVLNVSFKGKFETKSCLQLPVFTKPKCTIQVM